MYFLFSEKSEDFFCIVMFLTVTEFFTQNDVPDSRYKVCLKSLRYGNKRPLPNFILCKQCINTDFNQGVARLHINTGSDRFMAQNLICTAGAANQELLI